MAPSDRFHDLVDFFKRWETERETIQTLLTSGRLPQEQADIVETMMFIIDRVGPEDFDLNEGL